MHFPPNPNLRTKRLILSPLAAADAPALWAIQSDPQVMRYWNHAAWTDMAQAQMAIEDDVRTRRAGVRLRLGLRRADTGELVGTCMLFALEEGSRRGEVGYNLATASQGQGYMAEALERFVDFLFKNLGFRRLEAEIDPRNVPSARLLERLGFRQEGLLRQRWSVGGEISDSALYGLLSSDRLWRA